MAGGRLVQPLTRRSKLIIDKDDFIFTPFLNGFVFDVWGMAHQT
jgi:hypothetical protein